MFLGDPGARRREEFRDRLIELGVAGTGLANFTAFAHDSIGEARSSLHDVALRDLIDKAKLERLLWTDRISRNDHVECALHTHYTWQALSARCTRQNSE